jgi:hypothetical protein
MIGRAGLAVARYLWAAPCTALGLVLTIPALLFGAHRRIVDGVIEIAPRPSRRMSPWLRLLPFNAITFGHVVFATSVAHLDRLRAHEHAHVRQYERWGPAFLLAYPASSLWQWARGRRAYADNWFEVQARAVAGEEPRPRARGRRRRARG